MLSRRVLNHEAAKAVRYGGVSEIEALKFVTLNLARQLRIENRVGSLEVGKDASLIITDGNPLETTTNVLSAYIQGRKINLSNRHLRLYKKYQQKYKQLNAKKN